MPSHKKRPNIAATSSGRGIQLTVPQYKLLAQFNLCNETLQDYGVFSQADWQTIQTVINRRMRATPLATAGIARTGQVVQLPRAMGQ